MNQECFLEDEEDESHFNPYYDYGYYFCDNEECFYEDDIDGFVYYEPFFFEDFDGNKWTERIEIRKVRSKKIES